MFFELITRKTHILSNILFIKHQKNILKLQYYFSVLNPLPGKA